MKKILKFIKLVLKSIKMGIISKLNAQNSNIKPEPQPEKNIPTKIEEVILSEQELEFILIKLRESNYKGHEFEIYARIYKKLVDQLKN